MAASPWDSASSSLWGTLGQASNVAQLVGVDALGLVSMVVQAALAARRHRDACRRLAQHVELVGGLLRELDLSELMRREATRRPLEQLRGALRRCYALVRACQDCGYLHRLLFGARMADELRAAQHEIDMYIRLIPLISLVDSTKARRLTAEEGVPGVVTNCSSHHIRFPTRVSEFTEIRVQRATKLCNAGEQPLVGTVELQEQKILNIEELVELCTRTEESCPGFTKFDFFQIVDATDNFSEKRNVGWGGFSTVYKGQLPNGLMVAIKRLDEDATVFEFNSEFLLARLEHTNLIRLLGWCIHGKERILVYEFMHKGGLHQYIFDKTKGPLLDWSKRFNVIKGLVEGLVYMHKHSMLWIVHGDLKPHNILLDYNMNPKICDFGSARTLSSDVAEERISRIVGTSGYIAPEYASRGVYSVKTDVFSFGILVLGPGCSSVGYGAASELGPLRVNGNGTGLEFNKFAWNKEANLLFLESPVGVGFSYTNTSSDLDDIDDCFVAEDTYTFLVNWFKRFPQYKNHDFYISGESYAGHYVPQLAEVVYERNKHLETYQHINLKGFMVGNAETDDYYDYKGLVEFAWSHSVISDQLYERVSNVCDFRLSPRSNECNHVMNSVYAQYDKIDIYNVYAPKCNTDESAQWSTSDSTAEMNAEKWFKRMRMYSGYDPCYSTYIEDYLNSMDVQKSLHANISGWIKDRRWSMCSYSIFDNYDITVFSVLRIYSKLVKAGLRIWVYSGDVDGRVPIIGSRYCVEALGLPVKSQWQPWYLNNQVAGRFVEYEGLTMATVRGAGHAVPQDKPAEALVVINSFLSGRQLPTRNN